MPLVWTVGLGSGELTGLAAGGGWPSTIPLVCTVGLDSGGGGGAPPRDTPRMATVGAGLIAAPQAGQRSTSARGSSALQRTHLDIGRCYAPRALPRNRGAAVTSPCWTGEARWATVGGSCAKRRVAMKKLCPLCQDEFPAEAETCPSDGSRLLVVQQAVEADPLLGLVVDGRYRVDALLGEGGMGTVYRAVQVTMNRPVALKVLRPELATDPEVVKRFLREAQAVSLLTHAHTITVYDFGQTPDDPLYIAMEYLAGRTSMRSAASSTSA